MKIISEHACFGGTQRFLAHESRECHTEMRFSVYEPPQARERRVPVLYYLAGLTCTEETFMIKAGAQRLASELGLMLVTPDTSPRQPRLPGDDASWDFGLGAGFYVDATEPPWSAHYRMYSYVTSELPELVTSSFPALADRQGIFGHSMGGHGALVCALRNPSQYRSLSAFAPISAPMRCPWGHKAFLGYLGADEDGWRAYDATELVTSGKAGELVTGFRGRPAADVNALVDLVVRLAALAEDFPQVAELDLNPVIALADDCVAVDAHVRIAHAAPQGRLKSW